MIPPAATATPPDQVVLRWCPVCGKDDRHGFLSLDRTHMSRRDGRRCKGQPRELRYVLPPF